MTINSDNWLWLTALLVLYDAGTVTLTRGNHAGVYLSIIIYEL